MRGHLFIAGEATTYILKVAQQARARALGPLHPSFDIVKLLRHGLNCFLPDNAHEICSGRLHVSLTRVVDRQNVVITEFDSKDDLVQVPVSIDVFEGFASKPGTFVLLPETAHITI